MNDWRRRSVRYTVLIVALVVLIIAAIAGTVKNARAGKRSAVAVPTACQQAIADAERLGQLASKGLADSSGYAALIEQADRAGMAHNSSAIEAIDQKESDISAAVAQDRVELMILREAFNTAKAACS